MVASWNRSHIKKVATTLSLVTIGLIAANWLWRHYSVDPWTRDGRVRADVAHVAPDVSGLVTEVEVTDNMPVHRGQVLFVVDRARYQLSLSQAEASLQQGVAGEARAVAAIGQAEAGVQQAQANVRAQSALLTEARREDDRNRKLGTLVSTEGAQQGDAKVAQLEASLAQAQGSLVQAKAGVVQAQAGLTQAHATLQQATSMRDTAKLNLERTAVVAPVDGIAADVQLRPGDYLQAGHPTIGIVDASSLHVDGYFEETKLAHVHIGDDAVIELMGDDRRLYGHVEGIAPGIADRERTSSGDLLANITPTFNWVRLAQRVPVRVHIDKAPSDLLLIAGRTATVSLHEGKTSKYAPNAATSEISKEIVK